MKIFLFTISILLISAWAISQHDREGNITNHLNMVCQAYIANNNKAKEQQLRCVNSLLTVLVEEKWKQ